MTLNKSCYILVRNVNCCNCIFRKFVSCLLNCPKVSVLTICCPTLQDGRPTVTFTGDVKEAALRRFVRSAGVLLPLPGTLPEFDALAGRLAEAADSADSAAELLAEAEGLLERTPEPRRDAARYYVRAMRAVAEKGAEFVPKERERLRGVLKGKLSDKKRTEMEARLNVLQSFGTPHERQREEL